MADVPPSTAQTIQLTLQHPSIEGRACQQQPEENTDADEPATATEPAKAGTAGPTGCLDRLLDKASNS